MVEKHERPSVASKIDRFLKGRGTYTNNLLLTFVVTSLSGIVVANDVAKQQTPTTSVEKSVTPDEFLHDMSTAAVFRYDECGFTGATVHVDRNGKKVLKVHGGLTQNTKVGAIMETLPNGKFSLETPEAMVSVITPAPGNTDASSATILPLDAELHIGDSNEGTMDIDVELPEAMPAEAKLAVHVGSLAYGEGYSVQSDRFCYTLRAVDYGNGPTWVADPFDPDYFHTEDLASVEAVLGSL